MGGGAPEQGFEELAYVLSHDLQAPVRGIRSLTNWLREDESKHLSSEGRELLGLLDQKVLQLSDRLEVILNWSRAGRVIEPEETVCLRQLVDSVVASIPESTIENVAILGRWPVVVTQPNAIRQILYEVVKNSFSANRDREVSLELTSQMCARGIEIEIRDDGKGMAHTHLPRVFELFYSVNGGMGAGLAIAKKLVQSLGGSIVLRNRLEGGCSVRVHLPVVEAVI